jgi:glycosyltransferase involved in cell wall biosynthesis
VTSDDRGYAPYGLDRELVAFVEPTVDAVRSALLRLAGDAQLRARMGAYSAEVASRRFAWSEHVRALSALYAEAAR